MSRILFVAFSIAVLSAQTHPGYVYKLRGNAKDVVTKPAPGYFLAGGGADLDQGFRWMCNLANGGDFLVLRARGDDAYNSYIANLCPELNSVATLVISSREGAQQPFVAERLRQAEAIFISGGDQANYIRWWKGTPVQDILNTRIRAGVPTGGTSAGLDVMPQFVYSALHDTVTSPQALINPFNERVTLERDFLANPLLAGIVTDAHLAARDRMGRDVVFLARILQQGWTERVSGIFIDEKTAVLLRPDGHATVAGLGRAYFLRTVEKPELCAAGQPLTLRHVSVYRLGASGSFEIPAWTGSGGTAYEFSVESGVLKSTLPGGGVY